MGAEDVQREPERERDALGEQLARTGGRETEQQGKKGRERIKLGK